MSKVSIPRKRWDVLVERVRKLEQRLEKLSEAPKK